jgi:hypothetical protein
VASKGSVQVEIPDTLATAPRGYENWRLDCYPTGQRTTLDAAFRRDLADLESARPKHGSESGYALLSSRAPGQQAFSNGAFRPFFGVPGPGRNTHGWLFDMGHDRPKEFRAYAWGGRGPAWQQNGSWLVRVATRFGAKPFWSTAPTRTPWPEWVAAQTFGADTSSQSVSDWSMVLDPDETSGVLRIASQRFSAELHWIEDGRAINSIAGSDMGRPTSVVRTDAGLMLGVVEANRFRVYRMTSRDIQEVAAFPIQNEAKAALVRSTDASRLAVWVRSERGSWYVYPLSNDFTPAAPIVVQRERLSHAVPACAEDATGWLVQARPPLNRDQPDELDLLSLAPSGSRVTDWDAKVLVTSDGVCALEFSANLVRRGRALQDSTFAVPPSATLPLTVRDNESSDRLQFRCEPASPAAKRP